MLNRIISSGWYNSRCACIGEKNKIYIITDAIYELYEYDNGTNWVRLVNIGSELNFWSTSEACVYAEGFLFVINRGVIYRVNLSTDNVELFQKDDWGNCRAMVYDYTRKKIIIIINRIWIIDPITAKYENITEDGWTTTQCAVVFDNNLYIKAENFWIVYLDQKNSFLMIWEGNSNYKGMAVRNDKIFAFGEHILQINGKRFSENSIISAQFTDENVKNAAPALIKNSIFCNSNGCFYGLNEQGNVYEYFIPK